MERTTGWQLAAGVDLNRANPEHRGALGCNVLRLASPTIAKAAAAVTLKAPPGATRHVYLVVHPFDHFAVELTAGPLFGSKPATDRAAGRHVAVDPVGPRAPRGLRQGRVG